MILATCFHAIKINTQYQIYNQNYTLNLVPRAWNLYNELNSINNLKSVQEVFRLLQKKYPLLDYSWQEVRDLLRKLYDKGFVVWEFDPLFKKNKVFKKYLQHTL